MFFYEGFFCPVCGKAFTDEDDIVACPKCGAAHHRECWKATGHCAYEADHDTPNQWSREKARQAADETAHRPQQTTGWTCAHCGAGNPEFAEFCGRCGKERVGAPDWQSEPAPKADEPPRNYTEYAPYHVHVPFHDPMGGVDPAAEIDGVKAEDIAAAVGPNSHYYLPRFQSIAGGKRASWNWSAFLFTSYWLLYRKNYLTGIVTMIINIVATALNLVCSAQLAGFDLTALSQTDLYQKMFTDESFRYLMLSMTLVTLIDAALRVFLGLFGNWTYQNSICGKIHRLRQTEPDDYTE